MRYRARWIDAAGAVTRDETFEFDAAAHENAAFIRPEALIATTLDAPYFDLPALWAHLDGHIEQVVATPDALVILNDEARLRDGWVPNPHDELRQWIAATAATDGEPIYGPVVIVTRDGAEPPEPHQWGTEPVPQPTPLGTIGIMLQDLYGRHIGEWLTEYDPDRTQPGYPATGYIDCSPDPQHALRFASIEDAFRYVQQVSTVMPTRPDGRPNRPLTAFTITIEPLPL